MGRSQGSWHGSSGMPLRRAKVHPPPACCCCDHMPCPPPPPHTHHPLAPASPACLQEAMRLQALRHPNLVGFYGVCLAGSKGVVLLEYCEGGWRAAA